MHGKKSFLPYSALVCFLLVYRSRQDEDCNNFSRLAYEKPGNLTITGIFDGNAGENCSSAVDFGTEEMAAVVWTVTALERHDYLPGIKIGLSLFDACSDSRTTREAFVEAVLRESCLRRNTTGIGILASPVVEDRLAPLGEKLNKTVTRLNHMLDLDGMLEIATQLLTNLHWTTVNRVIAGSRDVLNEFSQKMSDEGICVYDEVLATDTFAVNNEILKPADVRDETVASKDSPVIVVLCTSEEISLVFEEMKLEIRELSAKWLIMPTDFVANARAENLPEKAFFVGPLVEKKDELLQFLTDEEMQKDHMNHREVTRSPIFVETALGILELLKPFKEIHDRHCANLSPRKGPCPELKKFVADMRERVATLSGPKSVKATPENMMKALNDLKIDANDNEMFLYITSLARKDEKAEDAAIFQIFDVKSRRIEPHLLIVNERLFNEGTGFRPRRKRDDRGRIFKLSADDIERMRKEGAREKARTVNGEDGTERRNEMPSYDKHPCIDILTSGDINSTKSCGICQNFIKFHVRTTPTSTEEINVEHAVQMSLSWRFRTWVAINASVASIGFVCALAVFVFIIFRLCRGDVLEGSPCFSFLILFGVMILYASTLPFSVKETDDPKSTAFPPICHLRTMMPAVGYSFLFSTILSRSVMLIFSERDSGFINHVNGYLQSVLCFFMCGVQVALTVQFWFYNYRVSGTEIAADCNEAYLDRGKFVSLMAYSTILLLFLAFAAPFTIRSKRNYKEGMFFGIATFLMIPVWTTWIAFYYFLPVEEKDAAIALGLTGTATTILLAVFIPRTYLMATAIVRDKITNSLPSLAYANSSNISDINYRSNQVLCDSATLKCRSPRLSFSKSRIYSVHMSNSAPASPNCCGGVDCPKPDDADYVLNRRRTFIEVTRTETPENTYESYESPDFHGKITKF